MVSLGVASSRLRGQGLQREGLEQAHSSRAQKTPGLTPHASEKPHCLAFGSDAPRLDPDQLRGLGRWPVSPATLVACCGPPIPTRVGCSEPAVPIASSLVTVVPAFHFFLRLLPLPGASLSPGGPPPVLPRFVLERKRLAPGPSPGLVPPSPVRAAWAT